MSKKLIPIIFVLALLLGGCAKQSSLTKEQQETFSDAKTYLQSEMDNLQDMLRQIGEDVGQSPANDEDAYKLLNEKLNSEKYFYDIVVCDKDTNILNVSTKTDFPWIGLNMGEIDQYKDLFVSDPVFLIKPLESVDNTPFIYCSVPIENGGWVVAYIDPYTLDAEFSALAIGQDIDLGVIDTNGTNVYTSNMTEIGKNVLTDDLYSNFEELRNLIKNKMIPDKKGNGKYTYNASGMGSPIEKNIEWDTVNAFGQELRIYANTEPGVQQPDSTGGELREFTDEEMSWFSSAESIVSEEFSKLSELSENAVSAYQTYGEDSEEFAASLADVSKGTAIARNVFFVRTDNIIGKAYPEYLAGKSFDLYGENIPDYISNDESFIIPLVIEDYQTLSEAGLCFVFPISENGKTAGWIVSQMRMYDLAAYLTKLESLGQNVNFMLVNSDGMILYDGDITEVGKNCLKDDLYTGDMGDFIKNEFMKRENGESEYEFYGAGMTETIPKRIIWKTVHLIGNDFRISMNSEWTAGN